MDVPCSRPSIFTPNYNWKYIGCGHPVEKLVVAESANDFDNFEECLENALQTGVHLPDTCTSTLEIIYETRNNIYIMKIQRQFNKHLCSHCVK